MWDGGGGGCRDEGGGENTHSGQKTPWGMAYPWKDPRPCECHSSSTVSAIIYLRTLRGAIVGVRARRILRGPFVAGVAGPAISLAAVGRRFSA